MNEVKGQSETKLIKELFDKILLPKEKLEAMFRGSFEQKSITVYPHFLVLTNERLIIWIRAIFDESFMIIPYQDISNVTIEYGKVNGSLYFEYKNHSYAFNSMTKPTLQMAKNLLMLRIDPSYDLLTDKANSSALDILQKRFALGEISELEYQRKLKILNITSDTRSVKKKLQSKNLMCLACGTENQFEDSKYCITCGSSLV